MGFNSHDLWRGVDAKLGYAHFHFEKTFSSLVPPRPSAVEIAIEASGAIRGHDWQRPVFRSFRRFPISNKERAGNHSLLFRKGYSQEGDARLVRRPFQRRARTTFYL